MFKSGQTKTRISASKAEAISQSNIDLMLLSMLRDIVAIKVVHWITSCFQVQSRRKCVLVKFSRAFLDITILTDSIASVVKIASTAPAAPSK